MNFMRTIHHQVRSEARHHDSLDQGMTLIEVVVAFVVLMIALIPLSYLFTTSVIQAGQSTNQQTALSIAEQWTETLSNVTPPVNSNGEVVTDQDAAPVGPAAGSTTTTAAYTVPASLVTPTTITVAATTTFATASATYPQSANVTTSTGQDTITYTGQTVNGGSQITALTGITGWSQAETIANGAVVTQPTSVIPTETKGNTTYTLLAEYEWTTLQGAANGAQPNLCVAGTPQLLKLRMTVSWGPNVDTNNVQDSVVIDYPPSGIQTLGFIALQVNGDSTATDSQGNPWSTRVQAPPVTVTQTSGTPTQKTLTIYPDQNGCAFAQVEPGTYTVAINNATTGHPFSNDTYGSPPFVENALGTVTANELTQPQSYTGTATVVGGRRLEAHHLLRPGEPGQPLLSFLELHRGRRRLPGCRRAQLHLHRGDGTGTGVPTGTAVLTTFNQATAQWATATLPTGVTRLPSVACATTGATTTRCIAVGYGSGGAVILSSPTTSATFTKTRSRRRQLPVPGGMPVLDPVRGHRDPDQRRRRRPVGRHHSRHRHLDDRRHHRDRHHRRPHQPHLPAGAGGCMATGTSTSPGNGSPVHRLGWIRPRLDGGLPQPHRRSRSPRSRPWPAPHRHLDVLPPHRDDGHAGRRSWPARPPPGWAWPHRPGPGRPMSFPTGTDLVERADLPVEHQVPAHRTHGHGAPGHVGGHHPERQRDLRHRCDTSGRGHLAHPDHLPLCNGLRADRRHRHRAGHRVGHRSPNRRGRTRGRTTPFRPSPPATRSPSSPR